MKIQTILLVLSLFLFNCSSDAASSAALENNLDPIRKPLAETTQQNAKIAGLELLCTTDNSFYYIDKPRENVYLYTEIKADRYENTESKRTPLNISIVIDRSGSMSGEKLQYAKEAAVFAVKQLSSDDYVSIISYGSDVTVVLPPTKVENTAFILNKILGIQSTGGTFLSGGMIKGFEKVKENFKSEYLNRVFLLSDGIANEGVVTIKELTKIVSHWKLEESISLSTFGIGLGFNEDLMTELSEYGGGNYYFISEPKEIPAIFEKELNGLVSLVAKDITLSIDYPEDMLKFETVHGYKFKEVPGKIHIDFSDMFSEEKKAIIAKFSIIKLNKKDINFLTKLKFVSTTAVEQERKETSVSLKISASNNNQEVTEHINILTMQQIILFESNYAMEKAAKELDNGNYDDARKTLEINTNFIKEGTATYGTTDELIRATEANKIYKEETQDFEKLDKDKQNFIQKSNKSELYNIRKKK
jgi:Ca-activated chloride channel family protein